MLPFGWVCAVVAFAFALVALLLVTRVRVRAGKPILIDPTAPSAEPGKPAFLSRPTGGKVYDGFPLIPETAMDGWIMGAITDPLATDSEQGCTNGDAFVQAPDGSRAGIVWEVGEERSCSTVMRPDKDRWGVYHVIVSRPVKTWADFRDNFAEMPPHLRELHAAAMRARDR